ncbi:helix-turn-helix transcriptional regulator [Sediminibacterium sp.]|uniref:helix-turn-helix domain-containing protein n=1 Tax=Sediminibacterium sp. TaxID=1917865 RepID=UPI0025F9D6AA|nr:helix-turn-helix transcriptional regulator [Sediminibacterium sp.]
MPQTLIRKVREQRNYTQDFVAKQMGISQNAYSKIENGYTQLTVKHIKDLSKILEVSLMELLRDDFEIHKPNHIHTESINKDNLLMAIKQISDKLSDKHPQKHDFYPIVMSLLQTVDTTVDNIH